MKYKINPLKERKLPQYGFEHYTLALYNKKHRYWARDDVLFKDGILEKGKDCEFQDLIYAKIVEVVI